jgi:hypothetical protein
VAAHNAGELAAQLQYALDYRVIIERGVGYLMARDQVDAMTAFDRLRRAARDTQTKIGDVAQRSGVDRPVADRGLSISEPLIPHHQ